jgi:hypothetical protein
MTFDADPSRFRPKNVGCTASSAQTDAFPTKLALDRNLFFPKIRPIMSETLSQQLAGIVLPDAFGKSIRLGSLWENSPAVLVFLRHYG